MTDVGGPVAKRVKPVSQYSKIMAHSQVERRRDILKAFRIGQGVGFLPWRGTMEGSAGDGRGDESKCWNWNCLANSFASTLKEGFVGVEGVAEAVRRKVDVGRVWREEWIMVLVIRGLLAFKYFISHQCLEDGSRSRRCQSDLLGGVPMIKRYGVWGVGCRDGRRV